MIPPVKPATREAIEAHSASGRRFTAGGVRSFALDRGEGPAVVLVHGVPSSSFLYRKVVPPLSREAFRALAPDFPGLGLADRPADFDYSWSGLAAWLGEAMDALEVERCHLVVHDIGGPVGMEWAVRNPDRVLSLTVLNSVFAVAGFRRPWSMAPFAVPGLGAVWLRSLRPFPLSETLYLQTIADRSATPRHELYAYYYLLKRDDGGRAFLKIMRGFERTAEKQRLLWDGLRERSYEAQIIWAERDPALGARELNAAKRVLGIEHPILLPAKHFPQEDHAEPLAHAISDFASPLA
jgi:pimeloyl-ACP methyl ester carboxylesterase